MRARVVLLWCLLVPCGGATATFADATGSHRWQDAANWTPAPPQPGDLVVLPAQGQLDAGEAPVSCAGVTITGPGTIRAGMLAISGPITCVGGEGTILGQVVLAPGASVTVASAGRLTLALRGSVTADELRLSGDGTILLRGSLEGAGGITCAGPGRVELAGAHTLRGGLHLTGGETYLVADVPAAGPSPVGLGGITIDGGCLVDATAVLARPITVAAGGGRLDAHGQPRVITAPVRAPGLVPGGLWGSYCSASLRALTVDDWRGRREVQGKRLDARVDFPTSSMGSDAERRGWHIAGTAENWDDFSVQWDGFLRVDAAGSVLATLSDDGSRVRLEGLPGSRGGVWGSNGWGDGQAATLRTVSPPLPAGVYPIRIQYEDGGGPNCIELLWSDLAHSAGSVGGMAVVPSAALLHPSAFVIGGDDYGEGRGQPLTLQGALMGGAFLRKVGRSTVTLSGPIEPLVGLIVDGGTLAVTSAIHGVREEGVGVEVHAPGTLVLGGGRLATLAGDGTLVAAQGELELGAGQPTTFAGTLQGPGMVRWLGPAAWTLTGTVTAPLQVGAGEVVLGNGQMLATLDIHAPLSTRLELPVDVRGPRAVDVTFTVPPGAPADLGWGVAVGDAHGHWCQELGPAPLTPGQVHVVLALHEDDHLVAEPTGMSASALLDCANRTVLCLFSASRQSCRVGAQVSVSAIPRREQAPRLCDVESPGPTRTGQRASWLFRVLPVPSNPYDPALFAADATITGPAQRTWSIPAFFWQDMRRSDEGDRERLTPTGREGFCLRFRPPLPGSYQVRLHCHWGDGAEIDVALPSLVAEGPAWDGYLRVDDHDPRFFSCQGAFVWPYGLNLRSVNDARDQQCLGTLITPNRGSLTYDAYLARLAAAGATATEVWLAPWNLGMEWRGDWNGFYGQGRYNQANAWRVDELLAQAERLGIRVNLVVHNHGQASVGADHEWENNPYSRELGGQVASARGYFTDAWALAGQAAYHRYLIARFADAPAILGWKLWSEVNLTAASRTDVVAWHAHTTAQFHAWDVYHHPLTTHWAGDWHAVNPSIARLPGIDYLCIDAYHGGGVLADLLADGAQPGALGQFHKPVLPTECGGNWNAGPPAEVTAEQTSAGWAALVSGYAGGAMLWWFEFVDQHNLWLPYGAVQRFLVGEDLRGPEAHSQAVAATGGASRLWARTWVQPGRRLGYCLDTSWETGGPTDRRQEQVHLDCGLVDPGPVTVEWWDADLGTIVQRATLVHAGGTLFLTAPPFVRHLAFKIRCPLPAPTPLLER